MRKELDNLRSSLQQQTNSIDYVHICSKFLKSNDLKLKSNSVVQQKKFYNFLKEKRSTQDPEKVIFNFSKYVLSDCEKSLLTKGLNFSIPCKKLDYADYLVQFELFFRDIRNLDILSNEDLDFVKAKTKLRKQHYLLIDLIIIMYLKICLRRNSLLCKTSLKIRT